MTTLPLARPCSHTPAPRGSRPLRVQHDVVAREDFGEVLLRGVHDDVGAEAVHQLPFLAIAVVATVAPRCLANWITVDPRRRSRRGRRTFWPGFMCARSTRACQLASDT